GSEDLSGDGLVLTAVKGETAVGGVHVGRIARGQRDGRLDGKGVVRAGRGRGAPDHGVADERVKLDRPFGLVDHPGGQIAPVAGGLGYRVTAGTEHDRPVDRAVEVEFNLVADVEVVARADPVSPKRDMLILPAGGPLRAGHADLEFGRWNRAP